MPDFGFLRSRNNCALHIDWMSSRFAEGCPFPAKGAIRVDVVGSSALPETPGTDVRADDSIGAVSRKLGAALGAPVYFCVWVATDQTAHADLVIAAFQGDLAAAELALFGARSRAGSGEDALRRRAAKGAYVCPYAVAGHPAAVPALLQPRAYQTLESVCATAPRIVCTRCTDAEGPPPQWAAPEAPDDGTEACVQRLSDAPSSKRSSPAGATRVSVDHLLVQEGVVLDDDDALEVMFDSLRLTSSGAVSAVLHRPDGSLSAKAYAPAVRAGLVDAANMDHTCRKMMRWGGSEMTISVACDDCDGPASVNVNKDLEASVTLKTSSDALVALKNVLATKGLADAVRYVSGAKIAGVSDDVFDSGYASYACRHVIVDAGGLNACAAALDRIWPLVNYTRTETSLEVTMARTPGHVHPSAPQAYIMRKYYMLAQGRLKELARNMSAELGAPLDECHAELSAFSAARPMRDKRSAALPGNGLLATVKQGADGLTVDIECACPLVYGERLLWAVKRAFAAGADVSALALNTQDILKALRDATASRDDGHAHVSSRYVLNRLYSADPDLFTRSQRPNFKMYSKICGAVDGRQPIAVTPEELQRLRDKDPDIDAVETRGTSYICPEVWCPALQTTMTAAEYAAAGKKCPDGGVGVDMTGSKYWRGATGRYPGLLGAEKHPAGLCMPCCFKKPQTDAPRGDSSYVLAETFVPLPESRLGRARALPGLLRRGVPSPEEFLSALAACLEKDASSVVEDIRSAASTRNLLRQRGLLPHFFDARHAPLRAREYAEFVKTGAGQRHLAECGVKGRADASSAKYARSLVVFDACVRYREYVERGGHAFLLPMLQVAYPDVLVGVLEGLDDGDVVAHTPLGAANVSAAVSKAVLILKTGAVYEPLVLSTRAQAWVPVSNGYAAAVRAAYLQARSVLTEGHLESLQHELRDRDIHVSKMVLTDGLEVAGVLTVDAVFVPLPRPEASSDMKTDVMWYDDVPSVRTSATLGGVLKLFEDLSDALKWEHLRRPEQIRSRGAVVALKVAGHVVPLTGSTEARELFRTDQDAVIEFSRTAAESGPVTNVMRA